MSLRNLIAIAALGVSVCICMVPNPITAQEPRAGAAKAKTPGTTWTPPRTPDGQPDLQGIWDYRTATPLERPPQFAEKSF